MGMATVGSGHVELAASPGRYRIASKPSATRITAAAVTHRPRRWRCLVEGSATLTALTWGAGAGVGESSDAVVSTVPGQPATPPATHSANRDTRISGYLTGRMDGLSG